MNVSEHTRTCILSMTEDGATPAYIAKRLRISEASVKLALGQNVRGPHKVKGGPLIEAIDQERLRRNITKAQLSELAGYNVNHWSNITCGKFSPSFHCVENMAQALGLKFEVRAA